MSTRKNEDPVDAVRGSVRSRQHTFRGSDLLSVVVDALTENSLWHMGEYAHVIGKKSKSQKFEKILDILYTHDKFHEKPAFLRLV